MSSPKVPKAEKLQNPTQIDDTAVVAAKNEAVRRSKGKGYLGTILTGFSAGAPSTLKQIMGA